MKNAAYRVLLAFVGLLSLSATFAAAQEDAEEFPAGNRIEAAAPLTLEELESIALERNPTLFQANAQAQISRGKAWQAGLHLNPQAGYVADQIGAEGTAGEFHGGYLQQEIVTGGKLRLSRSKYWQETRQARIQVQAQRFRVINGVRVAFYETLAERDRVKLHGRSVATAEEVVRTLRELENVGQANRADTLRARVRLQRMKAEMTAAQRRLEGHWEELAAIVGEPELAMAPLAGSLDFFDEERLDREEELSRLLACSPELQFARAEVIRDRIALERERVEPIPNVTIRGEAGYNFESDDAVAGVELSLPIPVFDRNQGTIFQAQAEVARAEAEVQRVELMLRRRFAEEFADYQAALATVDAYRDEALPQSEQVYRLYLESFQRKRAAWPQVLEAQNEYLELADDYIDDLVAARRAEVGISGLLLQGALEQPPEPSPQGHRDATPKPR